MAESTSVSVASTDAVAVVVEGGGNTMKEKNITISNTTYRARGPDKYGGTKLVCDMYKLKPDLIAPDKEVLVTKYKQRKDSTSYNKCKGTCELGCKNGVFEIATGKAHICGAPWPSVEEVQAELRESMRNEGSLMEGGAQSSSAPLSVSLLESASTLPEVASAAASATTSPAATHAVSQASSPVSTMSLTRIQNNATLAPVAMEMASAQPSSTLASTLTSTLTSTAPASPSPSAVEVQGAANDSFSFDGGEGGEEFGVGESLAAATSPAASPASSPVSTGIDGGERGEEYGIGESGAAAAAASSSAMSTAPLTQKHLADYDEIGGAIGGDSNDEKHSQSQVRLRRSKRIHTSQSVVPSKSNQRKKSATQTVKEILKNLPTQSNDEVYEEETAWRFHNQNLPETSTEQLTKLREEVAGLPSQDRVGPNELKPLPKAPPLPQLPDKGFCKWSFNQDSRVLLADFRASSHAMKEGQVEVIRKDKEFLLTMMERDDITVISQGLADAMDPFLYSNKYIEDVIGSCDHHKVRRFTTTKTQIKGTGWHSMKFGDYFDYIKKRGEAKDDGKLTGNFTFKNSDGEETTVDLVKDALYMLDVDVVKLLPKLHKELQQKFKLPEILPGGSHCMMSAVNVGGRPFMGPNMYLTPPASFTHFHQDGHGTVDSGHLCLAGYNEVVMLRRLTERHKSHALMLLTGSSNFRNTLYDCPHADDAVESQPGWPNNKAIADCERMGYCPSVFILEPGQVVHINKGRLHAFRKMGLSGLAEDDCHFELRKKMVSSKQLLTETNCCSIAWDWMFTGVTSEGINREMSSILECSRLLSQYGLQSLAIPETALIFLAKHNIALHKSCSSTVLTILRGILPSLEFVVHRQRSLASYCEQQAEKQRNVSIYRKPISSQDPSKCTIDPYCADYFCKLCNAELSNVYMRCDGCDKVFNMDFNICCGCHEGGRHKSPVNMHPTNDCRSILKHTGDKEHQCFSVCFRFMTMNDLIGVLESVKNIVDTATIPHHNETLARLLSMK